MKFYAAQNIDRVLGFAGILNPVQNRANAIVNSMWDMAVDDIRGDGWSDKNGTATGVVILNTNDVRKHVMELASTAKQSMQDVLNNPNYSLAKMSELSEKLLNEITAVDYIMTALEGYASTEQFIIYAQDVNIP